MSSNPPTDLSQDRWMSIISHDSITEEGLPMAMAAAGASLDPSEYKIIPDKDISPSDMMMSPSSSPEPVLSSSSIQQQHHHQHHRSPLFNLILPILSEDVITTIFRFFSYEDLESLSLLSHAWKSFIDSPKLWRGHRIVSADGSVDRRLFRYLGQKVKGTEGTCSKVIFRGNGRIYCMKKARVNPSQEGVPYYMLREIEYHCNVAPMANVCDFVSVGLYQGALYGFFPYATHCLYDAIYRQADGREIKDTERTCAQLEISAAKRFLYHILRDVARCHAFGIMHRNIKPKHILMRNTQPICDAPVSVEQDMSFPKQDLHTSFACLADFALVRTSTLHTKTFTSEVVTLWYRAPEVLLGDRYEDKIDVWSVGCVFAEMLQGRPLFPGTCEVDQLFQIFQKLGTPTPETWQKFEALPHKTFEFPKWPQRSLGKVLGIPDQDAANLLEALLCVNPQVRITAKDALQHKFFDDCRDRLERELQVWFESQGVFERPIPRIPLERLYAFEIPRIIPARDPFEPVARTSLQSMVNTWHASSRWVSQSEPNKALLTASMAGGGSDNNNNKPIWAYPDSRIKRVSFVKYLSRIIREYEMSVRTFYLALNFVDRYLNIQVFMPMSQLPLLVATCLHIASKCEDVSYMGVKQLVKTYPGMFSEADMLRLEEDVVKDLDFTLAVPTPVDFVVVLLSQLFVTRHGAPCVSYYVNESARFLCYLAAFHSGLIAVPYSEQAAASVWLACCLHANDTVNGQPGLEFMIAQEFKSGQLMREGVVRCPPATLLIHMAKLQWACQTILKSVIVARSLGDEEKYGKFMRGRDPSEINLTSWGAVS